MKVLYIASEPGLAVNAVAIASGVSALFPGAENVLIDPRALLWPGYAAPSLAEEFVRNGFSAEMLDRQEYRDVLRYGFPVRGYLFYSRLFQRLKPSVVVVMHEYGYAYYAVQAAKLFGIPSYHIQHAIYQPDRFEIGPASKEGDLGLLARARRYGADCLGFGWSILQRMRGRDCPEELLHWRESLQLPKDERYPICADRIGVWSTHYKRLLLKQRPEFGAERIDVVGFPHGDSMFSGAKESAGASSTGPGKIAIYLYCPFHEIAGNNVLVHPEEALLEAIVSLRQIDPGIRVVLIPHPNYNPADQLKRLEMLVGHFDNVAIRENSSDFIPLCQAASLVTGVISSLFYIAMLAKVPVVIQAYVLDTIQDYQAIEGGGAIPVFSRTTLPQQLDKALNDTAFLARLGENQKALCAELLGDFDGKSGVRTASAISALIRGDRKTTLEGGLREHR